MSEVLVDNEDTHLLSKYKFYSYRDRYYQAHVHVNGKRTTKYLHQLIMGNAPVGMVVDHINRNKLDNRRCNLRFITVIGNSQNRTAKRGNASGVRGVSLHRVSGKWRAHCRRKELGRFDTIEEAAIVAKTARIANMPGAHD